MQLLLAGATCTTLTWRTCIASNSAKGEAPNVHTYQLLNFLVAMFPCSCASCINSQMHSVLSKTGRLTRSCVAACLTRYVSWPVCLLHQQPDQADMTSSLTLSCGCYERICQAHALLFAVILPNIVLPIIKSKGSYICQESQPGFEALIQTSLPLQLSQLCHSQKGL